MSNEQKRVQNTSAGFTLIEVLLVVAILGILAGVVVVNFSGRQKGAMINNYTSKTSYFSKLRQEVFITYLSIWAQYFRKY